MREQLIAYVQKLFDRAADTLRNRELQEEILQNTLDRYDDLVSQGVPEETAYAQAVEQIGDVRKLWEAGPKKPGKGHGLGLLARALNETMSEVMEEAKSAMEEAKSAMEEAQNTRKEPGTISIHTGGKCKIRYADAETYSAGPASVPAAGIETVKLHWYAGQIAVEPISGDAIVLRETGADRPEHQLQWRVQDNMLEVQFVRPGVYFRLPEKILTVGLPRRLTELTVSTVSADLNAENLDAEKLKMETVSGDGDVSGELQSLKWESVSGDLDFRGRSAAAKINTVSGNVDLDLGATPDQLTMEAVSGDLRVTVPGERSFHLQSKTVSGDLESHLPLTKLGKKEWQYSAGGVPAEFQMETVSGDVSLQQS